MRIIFILKVNLFAAFLLCHGGERELWREEFGTAQVRVDELGGEWTVADGVCLARGVEADRSCFFLPQAGREIEDGTVEARVFVSERLSNKGWASAGLSLRREGDELWMLALTEGPNGERYVDLIESFGGRWQAQGEGETRLEPADETGHGFVWTEGVWYRLRLELTREAIMGTVLDDSGSVRWQRRYRFGNAPAVRSGRAGLLIRGSEARFDDLVVRSSLPLGLRRAEDRTFESGPSGRLAVLCDQFQGAGWKPAGNAISEALRRDGWGVSVVDGAGISDEGVLHPSNIPLLVVPGARSYPANGFEPLRRYLRHGGRVLFLGAPPLESPVVRIGGQWLDREGYERSVAATRPESVLEDGDARRITWTLSAGSKDSGARFEPGRDGETAALRYEVGKLSGWAVFRTPEMPDMFPGGHDLLCLRVKGDAGTPALAVELVDRDGSRWMGSVPLSPEWEWRAVPVSMFNYWPDSPAGTGRGGPGDRCRPGEVSRLAVGLIEGRDGVRAGPNGFWLDEIGTARNPLGDFPAAAEPPVIEGVSPSYKLYPCREIATLRFAASPDGLPTGTMPVPLGEVWAPCPRPGVEGFGRHRKWRMLPVVEALDGQGAQRGVPAWIVAQLEGGGRGSLAGCVGVADPEFFASEAGVALIKEMLRRMSLPCLLAEGGADRYCAGAGAPVKVGAAVLPCGTWSGRAAVRVAVTAGETVVFEKAADIELDAGVLREVSFDLPAAARRAGVLRARVELTFPGSPGVLDAVEHGLRIEGKPGDARDEDFVRVRGGEFVVGGKTWRIHGVNYWPRYVSGMEAVDFQCSWLSDPFYDPRQVEEDLALMNKLGINLVSIQLGGLDEVENLRDFLRRCRERGIRVNGFLGAASPLAFDEGAVRAFVEAAGLCDEPALFAYDIIWEPGNSLFNDEGRKRWAADWGRWVMERYGSVETAEKDWGFAAPRNGDRSAPPQDRQMREDGPWRVMVAAYRRFMDDFTSRKWNDATRRLREIDPNHLIGFRQGNTLPQDFALTGPVKHVDFISPEGYAITDLENGEDVAGFITRYVKLTSGGKPVYWSEFGRSVWDRERMRVDPGLVEVQGRYNALFHRMARWSGAQGVAPWWWPGGYRVNERSDYGLLDPDGSPRPSAGLFREHDLFSRRDEPAPGEWLIVDRDAHPGGYWHLAFNEGWQAFRRERLEGRLLGVRTAGTGATSANAPLVAVGNVPCHGSNPPKYLNAEFNWLQIRDAEGNWRDVGAGENGEIQVRRGEPVRVRACVGNLGEAAWIPPEPGTREKTAGAVSLSTRSGDPDFHRWISDRVPYLGDADLGEFEMPGVGEEGKEIAFEMTAGDRCWFGEKRRVKLVPRP